MEKRSKYNATTTKVQYMLIIYINDFNTKFLQEFSLIKQKWDELHAKYSRTCPITTREDIVKLTSFCLEKGIIIK